MYPGKLCQGLRNQGIDAITVAEVADDQLDDRVVYLERPA
jgi:hypothetical protein